MWIYLLAGIILAAAAWQDAVSHTIQKYVIVLLLVCGVLRGIWEQKLLDGAIGLFACGVPILLLSVTPRHGDIGGGDVKLCAALGALLGPFNGSLVILIALMGLSLWGLCTQKAGKPIQYAPFVLPAYMAVIFLQEGMI